jgi:hypothetical protein
MAEWGPLLLLQQDVIEFPDAFFEMFAVGEIYRWWGTVVARTAIAGPMRAAGSGVASD